LNKGSSKVARHFFTGYIFFVSLFLAFAGAAQEATGPVRYNPWLTKRPVALNTMRTTATTLSLPFFEDFTTYSLYPDSNRWADYEVYINNTMGVRLVSRGVATFDALDSRGIPYDSFSNSTFRYADSLTSLPIDLSANVPSDSVYMSFFYQPQGNGFYPLAQDSLMLFMKTVYGGYAKVWSVPGTTLQPFRQVMIAITDTIFFHSGFQFRFINKAALNYSDANWNIDYINLNRGRSINDTGTNDPAVTSNPTFLLNDYTSMPYRQFMAAPALERAASLSDSINNGLNSGRSFSYHFMSTALNTGTVLQSPTSGTVTIPALNAAGVFVPAYTSSIPLSSVGYHDRVVFQHKFYFDQIGIADPAANDTIVTPQVFDNYLAYDDGTAEKSYYLNLFPTLPGMVQVEYHLNTPDTMQGMAIYFGRQIPFAFYKTFTMQVYSALAGINGAPADVQLYSQDLCDPGYADTINHFWIYKFNQPLPLPAGTFYAGTMQPAESGSDSLYFGLDVNRVGGNHAYYNVLSMWNPSLISGAIMMRPLFGQAVTGSGVNVVAGTIANWQLTPNPARDVVQVSYSCDADAAYAISDMQGRVVSSGLLDREKMVNVAALAPGMYIMQVSAPSLNPLPQKFIKL
jgi:hypothetical protein